MSAPAPGDAPSAADRPLGGAVLALTSARLVAVLAQFVAGVVAARLLLPGPLGAASVGLSVGWIVAIVANAGLNVSAVYYLGTRPAERRRIVAALLPLAGAAVVSAAVLALVLAPLVGPPTLDAIPWGLFAAAGLLAAATVGYELSGAVLLGLGDRRGFVAGDLVRSAATLLAVMTLFAVPLRTAEGYVLATAVGVLLPAVFLVVRVSRRSGVRHPVADPAFAREALRMGFAGQVSNVLTFVNLRLDSLLVPALLTVQAGGLYFVATRVAEVLAQVSNAAASMLFPHVSAQDDRSATAATERVSRFTLLVTAAGAIVLALVAGPLLSLVFGHVYRPARWTLAVLAVSMLPLALGRVLAADLKGRGRVGVVSVAAGAGAGVTLAADFALLPLFGIVGGAWACVIAYTVTAVVLVVAYRQITSARVGALLPRFTDVTEVMRLARTRLAARPRSMS